MTLLGLSAQECSSLWLTCPEAYIGQQVVYTHTFISTAEPTEGAVTINTTGYFRLYVNGSIVSVPSYPLVRAPYRESADKTEPIASRFDVSRYLRNDSNTVSLLVSPSVFDETPTFSLCFSGVAADGSTFMYCADESWLCCPINAFATDFNSEYTDGTIDVGSLSENSAAGIMNWIPAEIVVEHPWSYVDVPAGLSYEYINKVIKPKYFSTDWNGKGISYDFGNGFYGLIRVTLRETKRGQHIYIAGSEYICKGQTDEQFVLRFAVSPFRKIHISGDKYFKTKNISKVEGLQIVPKIANNSSF